ncbi:Endonuclease/exonuclease/phosphatase [Plasmopara halstedii]|uniref:sphingomyelin phosphodiesterase n=1 Tax=Plasmopara halstedii TaxID=4781 RepID=A0A0N7L5C5_PLAHL|nr:Endonuclease/exonuclease/phosphatase [Plasmopara halstedii]CEG41091.1 Endonuclease/exonuclease/phosphatase [Plasmopara halstedii]|eukprot:XP_024577460.1 Endonuclease/exonuclease/phosphatase [Plasmopara halstedii]
MPYVEDTDLPLLQGNSRRQGVPLVKSDLHLMNDMDEYVCYGDRIAFLCEGQLLALTRKFNLTYQQMALLAASTLATGGLMGIAGFFVWRKGLFRKRYAALFGDEVYSEESFSELIKDQATMTGDQLPILGENNRSRKKTLSNASSRISTTNGVTGEPDAPVGGSKAAHGSVAFKLYEFDPKKQQLIFSSVGLPVKFGTPLVVVHAETGRAIRFLIHRGAVTISKPPVNLAFHRQVRASLLAMEDSTVQLNAIKRSRPQSVTVSSNNMHNNNVVNAMGTLRATVADPLERVEPKVRNRNESQHYSLEDNIVDQSQDQGHSHRPGQVLSALPRGKKLQTLNNPPLFNRRPRSRVNQQSSRSIQRRSQRHSLDLSSTTAAAFQAAINDPRSQPAVVTNEDCTFERTGTNSTDTINASSSRHRHRASSSSTSAVGGTNAFYRSISESYMNIISDLTDTLHQQRDRQRDRQELRRRQKALMKDLPNMSFNNPLGKYYVATIEPMRHQITGSNYRLPVAPSDEYLRWGQPMSVVAKFNNRACGIRPREYYKDSDLYLTTEAKPTTMVPLREDGDLKCMAKESTRLLAHLEQRHVSLSVGTYNVWMLPRKVSAFTSVSPKKNTRARLIGDMLPPCDIWVLTECFDYRARDILLDKMSDAGYFFFSPTVGHKRVNKSNMRKLLNGGVLLASKYPILSVRVKLFEVHVFATHLQAWNDPLSRTMRKLQMETVARFMRAMDIDEANDVVLVVGDLNVDFWLNKTNQEYDEMLSIFGAVDSSVVCQHQLNFSEKKQSAADFKHTRKYSFDPRVNSLAAEGLSTDGSLELLDYILYSRTHRQPETASSWLSVSLPLKCKIRLDAEKGMPWIIGNF